MVAPKGELTLRTQAFPTDANPMGDIFGGWILSQMDIAGALIGAKRAGTRVVTIAVDAMKFHLPVFVGDIICCYAEITHVGNTSLRVHIETWVIRQFESERVKVTEGEFTYVAVSDDRKPMPIKK
jgi:acyl-CoA thioesterase YciA